MGKIYINVLKRILPDLNSFLLSLFSFEADKRGYFSFGGSRTFIFRTWEFLHSLTSINCIVWREIPFQSVSGTPKHVNGSGSLQKHLKASSPVAAGRRTEETLTHRSVGRSQQRGWYVSPPLPEKTVIFFLVDLREDQKEDRVIITASVREI